ncbi:MAG: ABC transporter substrate-binding protein [Clostridiales bacterium]|nr:ABC transporter substrate-binding protein [Clostridiales bacterium]
MRGRRAVLVLLLALCLISGSLLGCSGNTSGNGSVGDEIADTGAEKTFIFGDTTFNPENEEPDVNPHRAYSGWACIRYGIGETLFHYSDSMEMEPWLAVGYENPDERTWVITLRDDVTFSSGRKMDGEAVRECLEHLVETHDRARGDLSIEAIEANGQVVTITTSEPKPAFLNYLSDPYGCIIDMQAGITDDGIVAGTGPYIVVSLVSGERLELKKNENYWNGTPGYDSIAIRTISDGDTLTLALQSGEIDAAYGLPYASYVLFQNDDYNISSCATSRAFFLEMNEQSAVTADDAVRQAIAMGIDKEGFVNTLLQGNGYAAVGVYPDSYSFGGDKVTTEKYDPDGAKAVLDAAGWMDSDGDGYREKEGVKLRVRWLTYPSRQELPLLAESAQATLKEIGVEVVINCTADHNSLRVDPGAWDVYASAMVMAPTGDPEYFFTTHCLDTSFANNGSYHSEKLEQLERELAATFDVGRRAELAVQMQQVILDDHAFVFCSHLKMSMVSRASVSGLTAHPCDFYEITADLAPVS